MTAAPRSLFDKLWASHIVHERPDGWVLLYIDHIFLHEGSFPSFNMLEASGRTVRRPGQNFAIADHLVPTVGQGRGVEGIASVELRRIAGAQISQTRRAGIRLYGLGDPDQGIVHVVGPEQGLTQPGLTIVCGDSHTSTHGAFGAFAFGVGNSELTHAMATQTLWTRKPRTMRIEVRGRLRAGVSAKDLALAVIGQIGAAGATEHVIEFDGPVVRDLSMAGRMTLCNMSIEAGSRAGMVAPDDKTYAFLRGRPHAPAGEMWHRAVESWSRLPSDAGAHFDRQEVIDGGSIGPMVTWGTSPEDVVQVNGCVPDPDDVRDEQRRDQAKRALTYMGLEPGRKMTDVVIDRVFIGSCTNARIEDLREAAAIVKGRRVVVPAWIVPGSGPVRRQAEQEGLARVFVDAGFDWREPGCSMCLGVNGETIGPGERCASTSNRNFEGRQGKGGRTHLMSPAMAAAAAVHGRIVDVTSLMGGQ